MGVKRRPPLGRFCAVILLGSVRFFLETFHFRSVGEDQAMLSELILLWWCLTPVGLVLFAIGVILWLCEWSWHKRFGSMGSLWFLGIGAVLFLPMALYLLPALLERLFG
jgi:hypothetical protein